MADELICVLDIGKTHSKIALLDQDTGAVTWSAERESKVIPGAVCRQLDVAGLERWLIASLKSAPHTEYIRTIVPVAHGATAALVDRRGELLAIPDYEDPVFDSVKRIYEGLCDPFCATLSPPLPLGLNLGIQLFYLQNRHAALFEQTVAILLYPQYWAWRLSKVMAREVTSLGCHTGLWRPSENRFSQLAAGQGWAELFPPLRQAGDVLGTLTPEIAAATGLDVSCRVLCGIHDSNASYLGQVAGWPSERPITMISSGTWTLIMSHGADLARLRPELDMLANVDAFGAPLSTARFMGGREYLTIAGPGGQAIVPEVDALQRVIDRGALALPSFAPAGGPFPGAPGTLVNAEHLTAPEYAVLATTYVALMSDWVLNNLGTHGDIIVDGPFATNALFGPLLAALRPDDRIRLSARSGAAEGAFRLANPSKDTGACPPVVKALAVRGLDEYRNRWQKRNK